MVDISELQERIDQINIQQREITEARKELEQLLYDLAGALDVEIGPCRENHYPAYTYPITWPDTYKPDGTITWQFPVTTNGVLHQW